MIGTLIGVAVFIGLLLLTLKWDKEESNTPKRSMFANVVFSLFLGVLAFVISDALACSIFNTFAITSTKTTEKVATVELVALQDQTATTGDFFLGSGSVNNKTHYAFYYKTESGYKYDTLDAESTRYPVYLKYTTSDTEPPHIDRYAIVQRDTYTATIDPLWFSCFAKLDYPDTKPGDLVNDEAVNPALASSDDHYYDNFRYEIIIPQGSIQQNYTIDLQ